MCEHAPPEPWCLLSVDKIKAALEHPQLCDGCRMKLESEWLARRQSGDADDTRDEP